jgi:hypothetical protein
MKSRIFGLGFLVRDGGKQKYTTLVRSRTSSICHYNFFVIVGPICGGGNRLFVRKLQSLDASNNLVHVATDASRVVEGEHQLVFGVDDKHSTKRKWLEYSRKRNKLETYLQTYIGKHKYLHDDKYRIVKGNSCSSLVPMSIIP